MTNKEFQKQISALAQQQLALATVVNQLSMLLSNSEALLEVAPKPESRGDSISSLADFVRHSRNYKNYATAAGRWIFDFLTSQAALDSLKAATGEGLPAVAGIAESVIYESIRDGKELTELDRQFIGAVVRFRMEANGRMDTEKRESGALFPTNRLRKGRSTNRSKTRCIGLLFVMLRLRGPLCSRRLSLRTLRVNCFEQACEVLPQARIRSGYVFENLAARF